MLLNYLGFAGKCLVQNVVGLQFGDGLASSVRLLKWLAFDRNRQRRFFYYMQEQNVSTNALKRVRFKAIARNFLQEVWSCLISAINVRLHVRTGHPLLLVSIGFESKAIAAMSFAGSPMYVRSTFTFAP